MKRKTLFKFVIIFIISIFVSLSAHATLVKPINFQQLVGFTTLAVKAKVTDQSIVDDDVSGSIVSYYTLEVIDVIKGEVDGNEVIIKQLANGEYTQNGRTIRQRLYFPEYEVGQTYVFFLPKPSHLGLLAPIGLFQGVFKVEIDSQGKETIPQFKARAKVLSKGLQNTNTSHALTKNLNYASIGLDYSYESFKSMVQSVKGDE